MTTAQLEHAGHASGIAATKRARYHQSDCVAVQALSTRQATALRSAQLAALTVDQLQSVQNRMTWRRFPHRLCRAFGKPLAALSDTQPLPLATMKLPRWCAEIHRPQQSAIAGPDHDPGCRIGSAQLAALSNSQLNAFERPTFRSQYIVALIGPHQQNQIASLSTTQFTAFHPPDLSPQYLAGQRSQRKPSLP